MKFKLGLPKSEEIVYIFCDESSQSGHKFCVMGGLRFYKAGSSKEWDVVKEFEEEIAAIKRRHGLTKAIKWDRTPSKKGKYLEGYKRVLDLYLDQPKILFKAMVINTTKYPLDHPVINERDAELGYRRYICVFISSGLMGYNDNYFFNIVIDKGHSSEKYNLDDLQTNTEGNFRNRFFNKFQRSPRFFRYCKINEIAISKSNVLQLTDILVGVVAAKKNRRITSVGKKELVSYIEGKLQRDIGLPSSRVSEKHFNLWEFKPHGK